MKPRQTFLTLILLLFAFTLAKTEEPINISGVYPHLRMWNSDNEAGTGAVVVWQGDLWAITYAPHCPRGSDDKLYRISPDLTQHIFEGSVGGTPANRMIHTESEQLLIGPYLINAKKNIRVIPPSSMLGRLTGNARHLTSPEEKVYYATMEEGLYEVDVKTLEVTCLIQDGHVAPGESEGIKSTLPGYHGKGLYSGQGHVVYSNNGEKSQAAREDPTVDSGALAEWSGKGDWNLVLREQFTEVTGPGGIYGNPNPKSDPLWAMGWDSKSLLLALLENGAWHYYRLPKGSHSYDGAHGWNTEWPRIREIGEEKFLATMHGTFWDFPSTFSLKNSVGIVPRSNYLKVIGDFCRWGDRLVLGCDDSAKGEFLNTRPFKSEHGAPKQSNSNLWFIKPDQLSDFGPAIGRGSVWMKEDVATGEFSLPYLFSGYDEKMLHLSHQSEEAVAFQLEVDRNGTGHWSALRTVILAPGESFFHQFDELEKGAWIRINPEGDTTSAIAHFHYRNEDSRPTKNSQIFDGLVAAGESPASTGVMRSLAYNKLGLVSRDASQPDGHHYHLLNSKMELTAVDDFETASRLVSDVKQPENTFVDDGASLLFVEDGKRYRLPRNDQYANEETATSQMERNDLESALSQNLLEGAAITVSSTHAKFDAEAAVDGELSEASRWIGKSGENSWIEFDLGESKTISSLWIVSGWKREGAFVAEDLDVQIRINGEWQTIENGQVRNNQSVEREIVLSSPLVTKDLRIIAKDDGFLRIYEIAAFDDSVHIETGVIHDLGTARVCREVATERDLLNVHGSVYELPARNAQGFAKIRPIATHNLAIQDFCCHNGLLFFTGVDAETTNNHIFRSEDGETAVWAGVIDDLWSMGKPRGKGGPWLKSAVQAAVASDRYLMTGYDRKQVTLETADDARIRLEVDVDGTDAWVPYETFALKAGEKLDHTFPRGFGAYWVRAISDSDTTATVQFEYR